MRKAGMLLAVTVMCLGLSGCGKKNAEVQTEAITETEVQTEKQTEKQTERQTEKQTEKQTEPETEKSVSSMNKTRTLNALVKESDSSKMKVQTARGKELTFAIAGADIQVAGGIANGNNVKVLYTGTIEDTDTSDAKVIMVKDIDAMDTPVTEGELMTEAESADPYAGEGTLKGSIEGLDANRVVVRGDDGDAFYFSTGGTNINLVNGMTEGNYVTVKYDGDVYGPEIIPALTIEDTEAGETKALYGPDPEGDYTYVNGALMDWGIDSVTIKTDEDKEIELNTSGAACALYYGFTFGNYITLECEGTMEGTDTSKLKVLAYYDYESNTVNTGKSKSDADSESNEDGSDDEYSDDGYSDDEYYDEEYSDEEYYDDGSYEEYYEEDGTY